MDAYMPCDLRTVLQSSWSKISVVTCVSACGVAGMAVAACQNFDPPQTPSVFLEPRMPCPGQTVTVRGSSFGPNELLDLGIERGPGPRAGDRVSVRNATTTSKGELEAVLVLEPRHDANGEVFDLNDGNKWLIYVTSRSARIGLPICNYFN